MNILSKFGVLSLNVIFLSNLLCIPAQALPVKKNTDNSQIEDNKDIKDKKDIKDESRYPIGCRPVGYKQYLKVISLYPGKEGALQSMYFFYNKLSDTVSLYQMRDRDSEYSTRYNHSIKGSSWAVLATGEPLVKFICTRGDGKTSYGQIIDCAKSIKICEYVNVKFGLNNKGNYWIVDSNTRNGAVSEVVHYGIIPGV